MINCAYAYSERNGLKKMNKDSIDQVLESSKNVLFSKSKFSDLFHLGLMIKLFDKIKKKYG